MLKQPPSVVGGCFSLGKLQATRPSRRVWTRCSPLAMEKQRVLIYYTHIYIYWFIYIHICNIFLCFNMISGCHFRLVHTKGRLQRLPQFVGSLWPTRNRFLHKSLQTYGQRPTQSFCLTYFVQREPRGFDPQEATRRTNLGQPEIPTQRQPGDERRTVWPWISAMGRRDPKPICQDPPPQESHVVGGCLRLPLGGVCVFADGCDCLFELVEVYVSCPRLVLYQQLEVVVRFRGSGTESTDGWQIARAGRAWFPM